MTGGALVAVLLVPLNGVLFCVAPAISRPTLQFGVRIPGDRVALPVVQGERRAFYWRTAAVAACCTATAVAIAGRGPVWTIRVTQLAEVIADLGCFGLARARITAAKKSGGWFAGCRQVVTTDTTWRTRPARFPAHWLAPAAAVIVATAIVAVLRYPHLPAGHAAPKPRFNAFGPVAAQTYVTAMWTGMLLIIYRSRPDIDVAAPVTSTRQYRRLLAVATRAILTLMALIDLSLLLAALRRWQLSPMPSAVTVLPAVVGLVCFAVVLGRLGRARSRLPAGSHGAVAARDDDRFWKGGLIYVNRDDAAIMVCVRFGVGWTFNFGNRLAWLVVGALFAGPVGLKIIMSLVGM